MHLPMRAYSSGMSARLRFAISTASRPDILLIDEALATGDVDFRQRSRQRVDEIIEHAGTVLLVSHSMSTIRSMCERVIWINKGLVEMDGPTEEVLDEYAERTGIPTARPTPRKTPADTDPDTEAATEPAAEPPAAQAEADSNASQPAL